ncbi:hypothetical protein FBU31_003133, partial [Coemansia sp. 'formosensis']
QEQPAKKQEAPPPAAAQLVAAPTAPVAQAPAAPTAQPGLQIQTQIRPPATDDGQAAKVARSRRGTNAARYVPGVGFVSDDGVSATSPQLPSAATAVGSAALRGVQPGSVARAPAAAAAAASGRMSPMIPVRMASPGPRSQSPLITQSGGSGERRGVDKDAVAKLQASLAAVPGEHVERALAGLAHESLVAVAAAAIVERRRTVESAVEWNKAVDKVLLTYDLIAGQIGSLKTLCESHDKETERLEALLAQSAQEARKWQEQCVRLSAEVEALKAPASAGLWSMGEPPAESPWAGAYYGQYAQPNNAFGHFAPAGFMPPGSYAQQLQQQQPPQQQQLQQQQAPLSSGSNDTSSSLLTALNARSQGGF